MRKMNSTTFCIKPSNEESLLYMIDKSGACVFDTQTNSIKERLTHTNAVRIAVNRSGDLIAVLEWSKKQPKLMIYKNTGTMSCIATVHCTKPCLEHDPIFGMDDQTVYLAITDGVMKYSFPANVFEYVLTVPENHQLTQFDVSESLIGAVCDKNDDESASLVILVDTFVQKTYRYVTKRFNFISFLDDNSLLLCQSGKESLVCLFDLANWEMQLKDSFPVQGTIMTFSAMKGCDLCAYYYFSTQKKHIGLCMIGDVLDIHSRRVLISRMCVQSWSCYCSERTKRVYFCDTFAAYSIDPFVQDICIIR